MLPAVEFAARTDPGRDPDKQVNEDACGHRETRFGHLCVVCDGMGGHAAGREAAELAVATIFEMFDRAPDGAAPGQVLKAALEEASRRVHFMRTSEVAMGRPGSTAAAVLLHAHGTEVAHVGDSRVYLVHEGQIVRVTRDHSVVQELVDRGLLTLQQAAHHPDANRITRALGMAPEVEADLRPLPVAQVPGDAFVLCSDGLSDLVDDPEILEIVGGAPAAQAAGKLVDLANARGGHDNITVLVLRAREGAQPPMGPMGPMGLTSPIGPMGTMGTMGTMGAVGTVGPAGPVAPTVAQTSLTVAPDTVPNAPPPFTEVREARATEPLILAPVVIPPAPVPAAMAASPPPSALAPPPATAPGLDTDPPPSSSLMMPAGRPGRAAVVVGVVLAVVAMVALSAVLLSHLRERAGKANPHGASGLGSPEGTPTRVGPDAGLSSSPTPPTPPTPLAPGSIVVPAPSTNAGAQPLAPLEPATAPSRGRR